MLHAAGRINDDKVMLVCLLNFLELRCELPQVNAMARRAIVDEVLFVSTADFLELRYELSQVSAVAPCLIVRNLFRERVVIGQLKFQLVLSIPFTPITEVPREG